VRKSNVNLPDTNTIIRYLIKDDVNQYLVAESFFTKVLTGEEKALILESVLVECIYILTKIYKVPKNDASASLIDLLHYKGIQNRDKNEFLAALNLFSEKNLDIVDCILCSRAKKSDYTLFTFDKDLKKILDK